jgi:hypothetical protein
MAKFSCGLLLPLWLQHTEFDPPKKTTVLNSFLHQGGRFSQIWLSTKSENKNLKKHLS